MMIGLLSVALSAVPGFTWSTAHWFCPVGMQKSASGNIQYMSGGSDIDLKTTRYMARNYNVELRLFDTKGALRFDDRAGLVSKAMVTIQGINNTAFLRTYRCGPRFVASLPQGRYRIIVEYRGRTQSEDVTAGEMDQRIDIHFPTV